ncbi:hypothetical protein GCM10023185_31550 [Hymenobacter saemangeumensis]|uniref:T9SS type A sorting domain-containing protein n=1 Tax=Hymenobacter saemangeumensis TaxID=1084522 RepID=A0ABP8IM63_9BACT
MTTLLRSGFALALSGFLLASGPLQAQQLIRPLTADPARASRTVGEPAALARTTVVALPFFDDFTTPREGRPNVQLWLPGGGTLVSNRLAINPPTRGAVTFDGLRADGRSYSNSVANIYTNIDSLTSQPINLAGLTMADSVYLSFAWQTGSIVGGATANSSSTPVVLNLQFRESNGRWTTAPGWLASPNFLGRSTGVPTTPFRQVVIPVDQARYLYGAFQFRFLAVGNSSYAADTWSVDYVLLNRGRGRRAPSPQADTTFADVATSSGLQGANRSGGLSSPLRRYTAMPVWQFNAAGSQADELNPQLGVNVMNLNAGSIPLPVNLLGTVRELNTGTVLGNWLSRTVNLTTIPRLNTVQGDASQVAIPTTAQPKRLRYTLAIESLERSPRTLPNDTIYRDVDLSTYYAYDDGTAEALTTFFPRTTLPLSTLAYRFDLNRPDRVRGLRLYPIYTAGDIQGRSVTVQVWADNNGQPGNVLASKTVTMPNPLPAGWEYYEATFDTPVAVSGIFYVGFSQPSNGREMHYGFDLNNLVPANYSWENTTGTWTQTRADIRTKGNLMMRPVMNNNIATGTAPARDAAAFTLYPNPTQGLVTVEGPGFARAALLDALGRTVWEQPAAQAGQRHLSLAGLSPGLYVLRLTLADGSTATRRLLLE